MTLLSRRAALAAGLGGLTAGLIGAPRPARAAPASELIDAHWTGFGAEGDADYALWAEILSARLRLSADGVARFDYAGARAADRGKLASAIAVAERARPTDMTQDAAFAYWANLYNMWTIALVLEEYPVESIKEVRGGWFNLGPWTEKIATVEGRSLSLDDIEHGVMRPVFKDPRVHYAVNCASIGCPNLDAAPFVAADLDARLDAGARAYVGHDRGARFQDGALIVSSIYDWFQEDFGGDDAGVIAHLKRYAPPTKAAALAAVSEIDDDAYDWALNDTATA